MTSDSMDRAHSCAPQARATSTPESGHIVRLYRSFGSLCYPLVMKDEATGTMAGEPQRASPSSRDPGLLLVYAPEATPGVILLEEGATIIGREPPPGGVVLPLTSVSRLHA